MGVPRDFMAVAEVYCHERGWMSQGSASSTAMTERVVAASGGYWGGYREGLLGLLQKRVIGVVIVRGYWVSYREECRQVRGRGCRCIARRRESPPPRLTGAPSGMEKQKKYKQPNESEKAAREVAKQATNPQKQLSILTQQKQTKKEIRIQI